MSKARVLPHQPEPKPLPLKDTKLSSPPTGAGLTIRATPKDGGQVLPLKETLTHATPRHPEARS